MSTGLSHAHIDFTDFHPEGNEKKRTNQKDCSVYMKERKHIWTPSLQNFEGFLCLKKIPNSEKRNTNMISLWREILFYKIAFD